jgi:CRP-like cAMP-binding protein
MSNGVPDSEYVTLQSGKILQEVDHEIEHVYFPEDGLISVQSVSADGSAIEIGVVGSEGMVGLAAVLGGGSSPYRAVVQLGGRALRIERRTLEDQFHRNRQFHDLMLRYANSFLIQLAQSSICNCFHSLQERLSRWLLVADDAVKSDRIRITHDVIAGLLATRRASITVTAGLLQKAGYIRMSRGVITIVDRAGLESVACECYKVVREGSRTVLN